MYIYCDPIECQSCGKWLDLSEYKTTWEQYHNICHACVTDDPVVLAIYLDEDPKVCVWCEQEIGYWDGYVQHPLKPGIVVCWQNDPQYETGCWQAGLAHLKSGTHPAATSVWDIVFEAIEDEIYVGKKVEA